MAAVGTIVDMRLRPPLRTWVTKAQFDVSGKLRPKKTGFTFPPSVSQRSMDLLLQEMNEAGVQWGVIMGRQSCEPHGLIPNDEIAECVNTYPDRFVAWAGIDVSQSMDWCIGEIRRCMRLPGFKGVSIEPTVARGARLMMANDRQLYPIYEECSRLGVPINITLSAFLQTRTKEHSFDMSHPTQIYDVASDFPELQIHIGHGAWPWVMEMIGVAYVRTNVWISPDVYFVPRIAGAEDYVKAANNFCEDRMLFGTAYPGRLHREMVAAYDSWDWAEGVRDKVMFKNALRLMNMD